MKKVLLFLFFLFSAHFSLSFDWNLENINLVTRNEWNADENILFSDYKSYKKIIENNRHNFEKIKKDKYKYKLYLEKQAREKTREKYLLIHFKDEVKADKVLKSIDGRKLWWDIAYKKNKDRIIIHHTAVDYNRFKNKKEVERYIRGTYYYHAIKRGWGDIGYNFLIDKFGNIYEGRAGGEGVIGANSKRNNVPSIGIALIGNFEIQNPTKKQIKALEDLVFALSKKYNIDPYKQLTYHKELKKTYPYIKNVKNFSLVGHKDTGYTSCPGKNLYKLLPKIREDVSKNFKKIKLVVQKEKKQLYFNLGKKFSFKDTIIIKNPKLKNLKKCNANTKNLEIVCYNDKIILKRKAFVGFKIQSIKAYSDKIIYNISLKPVFLDDVRYLVSKQAEKFLGNKISKYKIKKIKYKTYLSDAKKYTKGNVKVLLYDLSLKKYYKIYCKNSCNVITDLKTFKNIKSFQIDKFKKYMLLWINDKSYAVKYIDISSVGEIEFVNYKRKSYAGIKWNSFKGAIIIKKNPIKILNNGKIIDDFVVINIVNFKDYLKGVAEVNDQVNFEKAKLMALLIKTYVLFYYNKKNIHPSIPQNASYNVVDDPRIFQKYVGAGYERTSKKWSNILKSIDGLYLTYNNYIPILPYFNCSKGFTFSAKQKFGWIDTPYLVNNYDFGKCNNFLGHGVGLSGKGAEYLAKKGLKMEQILQWYFPGVKISK